MTQVPDTDKHKRYFNKELLTLACECMVSSPHTAALIRDPMHAYLCDGSCNQAETTPPPAL